jgi:putative transposase
VLPVFLRRCKKDSELEFPKILSFKFNAFGQRCEQMGVNTSMGMVGDTYDNAMAESFFAILECELIDSRSWKTKQEARLAIFTWIETWHNPHRRNSGLNYLSPIIFERNFSEK